MVLLRSASSRATMQKRVYTQEGMDALNLLEHPVWVFDIEAKAMWWANESALVLWNADSLEALLERNYSDDMSEATERRLAEYLVQFRKGRTVEDQWTYYPQGIGATTVHVVSSGIRIALEGEENGPRLAMLCEGIVPLKESVDQEALRGVEMLRHLPVAVCQFDLQGQLMSQNPESLQLFGGPDSRLSSFQSRFVDEGEQTLQRVLRDKDYCIQAQQQTLQQGRRWFSISLRVSRDPVTSQEMILYSARDTTEVVQAKEEADRANSEKSEFLAVMAHELRTPLHQVIGFIDLLSHTTNLTPQQLDLVRPMQSSSLSLMSIINDLLDYTKIEAGKLQLESIPFELKGVLEGCQQVMEPKTKAKGLELQLSCPVVPPMNKLLGDPNRLRQILLNLLQNAVKFTQSGRVTLQVSQRHAEAGDKRSRQTTWCRFQVQDTGIGIAPEDCQHIFQKYRQANPTIARRFGGTGLGLAICKSLVEAMGGSIQLESELGKGTQVSFDVPFEIPLVESATATPATKVVVQGPSLQVLVVEDNKMNQKVMKAMLQRMGHTVSLASNGKLGVEAVESNSEDDGSASFDCVLMDVQMPIMDGMEATKLLRSKGHCERILPIVGLTASYQPADIQFYRDGGMNDCIGKPARMQSLGQLLGSLDKLRESRPCSCPRELDPHQHHHQRLSKKNSYGAIKNLDHHGEGKLESNCMDCSTPPPRPLSPIPVRTSLSRVA